MKDECKGGRPNEIGEETIRRTYNITVFQANFIIAQAKQAGVTESAMMRELIKYVMAQYQAAGRLKQ